MQLYLLFTLLLCLFSEGAGNNLAGRAQNKGCRHNEFQCPGVSTMCIKKKSLCDNINDCPGNTDEEDMCNNNCPELQCPTTGKCIKRRQYCDGTPDCGVVGTDTWDENGCCGSDGHSCNDGTCVPKSHKCDAKVDCADASDESLAAGCDCEDDEFICADGEQCVLTLVCSQVCDEVRLCRQDPDGGKGKFPTNSTPLFTNETPYKKVDTSRAVADLFTDAIEAEGKEDVFDLNSSGLLRNTQAGTINIANIITWPFLQGKGVSIVSIKAPPCSTGIPHFHPNHDELNYIVTGSNITVGIKENLKPLNLMKNVKAGNVVLAPQGSIHFFINLSCTKVAEVIQIYPTELSTTTTIASNIVSFPSEIFATAFNTDIDLNEALKETQLQEVEYLRLDSYCLKRCGLLQAF